eukprot:5948632-Pleurochrysis_carterae.AAC.4
MSCIFVWLLQVRIAGMLWYHESRERRSAMAGTSQSGPWRAFRYSGEATWLRSPGCSRTYSAPASRGARSNETVRATRRLDCSSSRRCWGGTSGRLMMWSRSRTRGGLPSATLAVKNLLTEKVEQGGEATTAA